MVAGFALLVADLLGFLLPAADFLLMVFLAVVFFGGFLSATGDLVVVGGEDCGDHVTHGLDEVLVGLAAHALAVVGQCLAPFLPRTSTAILSQLGADDYEQLETLAGTRLRSAPLLFPKRTRH